MQNLSFDVIAHDRASKTLKDVGDHTSRLHGVLSSVGGALKGLAVGAALGTAGLAVMGAGAVKMGISTAAATEQASIAFTQLLGSSKASGDYIAQLQKFAANTPFDFPGLVDSSRTLIGVGLSAKQTMGVLQDFGDTAGALGIQQDAFQRIMLATSQGISAGKFQAGDLNQIMTNGIPIWTILAKSMHKSVPELRDMASHGKLLAKDVLPALQSQMHKDYGGAMAKQSQSLAGLWSTFQDTLSQGMGQVLAPLVPILERILPGAMTKLGDAFKAVADFIPVALSNISGFWTVLMRGPSILSDQAAWWLKIAGGLHTYYSAVIPKVVIAFKGLWIGLKAVWSALVVVWGAIRTGVNAAMPALKFALDNVKDAIHNVTTSGIPFKALWMILKPLLVGLAVIIGGVVLAAIVALSLQFKMAAIAFKTVVVPAIKFMAGIFIAQVGLMLDAAAFFLGWLPHGIGDSIKKAAKDFHKMADNINNDLNSLHDKTVTVRINTVQAVYGSGGHYVGSTFVKNHAAGGAVVLPRQGGTDVNVGEGGQPEAIVPLSKAGQYGFGGGDIHIHVHGSVISTRAELRDLVVESLVEAKRRGIPLPALA